MVEMSIVLRVVITFVDGIHVRNGVKYFLNTTISIYEAIRMPVIMVAFLLIIT